ncbi:MAG: 30S ribosome-binding factor RbfA [Bacteroidota bacterium]
MAETIVQRKIAKLIQREVGEIMDRGKFFPGAMLTLSVVRITRDLSIAKLYVSSLPEQKLDSAVQTLNEEAWQIRKLLAQRIRNKVRKIPELRFFGDDTLQEVDRIEKLLDEVINEDSESKS